MENKEESTNIKIHNLGKVKRNPLSNIEPSQNFSVPVNFRFSSPPVTNPTFKTKICSRIPILVNKPLLIIQHRVGTPF